MTVAARGDGAHVVLSPPARARALGLRLVAAFYDALAVFALLFGATAALLPFTGGEAIAPGDPLYGAYLAGLVYLYFAYSWRRRGQTLGLRAWRLRVRAEGGGPPSWRACTVRFLAAVLAWGALGAGVAWILVDPRGLAWHDRWSGTRVVRAAPRA